MEIIIDLRKKGLVKIILGIVGVAAAGFLISSAIHSSIKYPKSMDEMKIIKKQLEIEKNKNEILKWRYRILKEKYDSLREEYKRYVLFHSV